MHWFTFPFLFRTHVRQEVETAAKAGGYGLFSSLDMSSLLREILERLDANLRSAIVVALAANEVFSVVFVCVPDRWPIRASTENQISIVSQSSAFARAIASRPVGKPFLILDHAGGLRIMARPCRELAVAHGTLLYQTRVHRGIA